MTRDWPLRGSILSIADTQRRGSYQMARPHHGGEDEVERFVAEVAPTSRSKHRSGTLRPYCPSGEGRPLRRRRRYAGRLRVQTEDTLAAAEPAGQERNQSEPRR